ncbi:MAG: zf-HC2 domain-containing protein [Planctomycetota bacterium]|nr:zf-HC2 domain-containing protein [Planctomycetota bacterium]
MTERTTRIENEPFEFQEEWLSAYLDGELTSEQRSAVEARLQYDSNVQQMLLDLQKVRSLVAGLPEWPSAFGSLRDFQVPGNSDDAALAEPPAAGEVLLESAKSVEELKPLNENTTFDAPRQNDIEEPSSPPLKMQTSEKVLGTSRETEDLEVTQATQKETKPVAGKEADNRTETPLQHEHLETQKRTSPEIGLAGDSDDSFDADKQSNWDDRADEETALESGDSDLVAAVRESASFFSDDSKQSILPRLATAASLFAMLGLGYFLWEPIAGSIGVAARSENSPVKDQVDMSSVRGRPESDEKLPAAPAASTAKKPENFSSGESADASVDSTEDFDVPEGRMPFAEAQSRVAALEQSRLPAPSDSGFASNSQVDKSTLPPTGVVPPAIDSPRRMQSGFGGKDGVASTRSIGGGDGGLASGGGTGLPPAGMKQAPVESTRAAPGFAAPKITKMENGLHLAESKVKVSESAAPVMELASLEDLPDQPLSESESPDNAPRLGSGIPAPPAKAGIEPDNQTTIIAGLDLGILPQLNRQTKIPLSRYEVVSDGSWSVDQMKQGLLRLNNHRMQNGAPEAAIGKFEGTTELLLKQILENTTYQKLSRSLANRGRQQPVGEATSSDFSEAASFDLEKESIAPAKSILLFTHRAAAEKLLQLKSVSEATGQYLWVRSPNGRENPGDKVLLLLNPKQ